MKKQLLLAILVISVSCNKKATAFQGLGTLTIGTVFTSLPVSKTFTKVMDDEFNTKRFQLSNEIGLVSNLNVTIDHGKICEVTFYSNEETNITGLENVIKRLKEVEVDKKGLMNDDQTNTMISMYTSEDEEIIFFFIKHTDQLPKNGLPLYEVKYLQKDAVE